jgi:hypothetical protein
MKSIIFASVLFACVVLAADETTDRAAIEKTIQAFSMGPLVPDLYTSDFDREELVRFAKAASTNSGAIPITFGDKPGELVISKEPMGEASWFPSGMHWVLTVRKIRFLTPEVAMVDVIGKAPGLILLKKVGTDWKIASLRVLPDPS